jgi:hypothetical protein
MTQPSEPGASARPDWLALSDDLEALFVARRRLAAAARLQAAEFERLRSAADPRDLRAAWNDANHMVANAVGALMQATDRLEAQAAAIVGLALDADDKEA